VTIKQTIPYLKENRNKCELTHKPHCWWAL